MEQDPEELWQALVHVLRPIASEAEQQWRILALALAAQSGSLLPARTDGRRSIPSSPGWTAAPRRWSKDGGPRGFEEQVRSVSGWHLYPGLCLPTIAWLRQHQPEVFAAAGRYFSVNDFLVHRLTGRFCTNPSNGGGMQLVDVSSGDWSPELCALAGIEPEQLSPIRPAGAVVGRYHGRGQPPDRPAAPRRWWSMAGTTRAARPWAWA